MKIISGHQPTYLPWLGFFHKASLCDVFIFMNDVQYLEQDWNNRNKIKTPQGSTKWLSVPIDLKSSESMILKDILIAKELEKPEKKRWNNIHFQTLQMAYGKTPYFKEYKPFFEWLYFDNEWNYLSELCLAIFKQSFEWFHLKCEIAIASDFHFKNKKSDLILEHGLEFHADLIVTGSHGKDYIKVDDFKKNAMEVYFQNYNHPKYDQFFGDFISNLSFIDLLFYVGPNFTEICFGNNITRDELCKITSK